MVKPFFSDQARAAAIESRRTRAVRVAEAKNKLAVFAIMAPDPGRYTWQIRKFGSVVVETSSDSFESQAAARIAGEASLASGRIERDAGMDDDRDEYYLEKMQQCLRLAAVTDDEQTIKGLTAMAAEFKAKAEAARAHRDRFLDGHSNGAAIVAPAPVSRRRP